MLYVYAPLQGSDGQSQAVLISVELVQHGYVTGMIENEITVQSRFSQTDWYAIPEADLIDWLIVHADGSEEGGACQGFAASDRTKASSSRNDV